MDILVGREGVRAKMSYSTLIVSSVNPPKKFRCPYFRKERGGQVGCQNVLIMGKGRGSKQIDQISFNILFVLKASLSLRTFEKGKMKTHKLGPTLPTRGQTGLHNDGQSPGDMVAGNTVF